MRDDDTVTTIWSTWPDEATAQRAAHALVEARLVACAVVMPGLASVYRWQGRVEQAEEVGLLIKTSPALAAAAAAAIERDHPYEVPAVLTVSATAVTAYAAWVRDETSPRVD